MAAQRPCRQRGSKKCLIQLKNLNTHKRLIKDITLSSLCKFQRGVFRSSDLHLEKFKIIFCGFIFKKFLDYKIFEQKNIAGGGNASEDKQGRDVLGFGHALDITSSPA